MRTVEEEEVDTASCSADWATRRVLVLGPEGLAQLGPRGRSLVTSPLRVSEREEEAAGE